MDQSAIDEKVRSESFKRFEDSVLSESDPVMVILRAHLYSESILEELIRLQLPRADRVLDGGNLSYAQKLSLVNSFDHTSDDICSVLKGLNRIRNECAHQLDKIITESDVIRIGSPLGNDFTKMKRESRGDANHLLKKVLAWAAGSLHAEVQIVEDQQA